MTLCFVLIMYCMFPFTNSFPCLLLQETTVCPCCRQVLLGKSQELNNLMDKSVSRSTTSQQIYKGVRRVPHAVTASLKLHIFLHIACLKMSVSSDLSLDSSFESEYKFMVYTHANYFPYSIKQMCQIHKILHKQNLGQ